jgi:glycosyltransferase involved in cell wall biosynthesis
MKIGVSAFYRLQGGALTHLRQVLTAWSSLGIDQENEVVLFSRPEGVAALGPAIGSAVRIEIVGTEGSFGTLKKLLWEQIVFPRRVASLGLDVLFCTGSLVPLRARIPIVVALRNLAPFCETVTPGRVGWRFWMSHRVLGALMRLAARRADRVIFISEEFRNVFVTRFAFPPERGDLIYHGRDAFRTADRERLREYRLPDRFLLYVSRLYPYKNVLELIQGYVLYRRRVGETASPLLIVGRPADGEYHRRIQKAISENGLDSQVLLMGEVPHDVVGAMIGACHAFVFPSTCEGCPNALVEALAAGVPIASSNVGVMPEIAGRAAVYFDPARPTEIAEALERVSLDEDLRSLLRERARDESLRFPTWEQVSRRTLDCLRRAVGERPSRGRKTHSREVTV